MAVNLFTTSVFLRTIAMLALRLSRHQNANATSFETRHPCAVVSTQSAFTTHTAIYYIRGL
jgi:hypothetical protein